MGKIKENNEQFLPMIAIPPGETIKEYLDVLEMTQAELATRLGITTKHLNSIVKASSPITYETAIKLERVIGPSAEFWANLEKSYQLDKARLEEESKLKEDYEILKKIPYNELSKLGWMEQTRNKDERVKNSREFFKVATLGVIENSCAVAFRLSKAKKEICDFGVLAWLKKAEERGAKSKVSAFNKSKLKSLIPRFRELTLSEPGIFYDEMKTLCSECGIALVLVESVPKTYINGATIWKGNKAILALSVRGKKADIFWFTFFHELAHLIEHSRKEFHINFEQDQDEDEADRLARNYLIQDSKYNYFVENYDYYDKMIINSYSKELGIAPCILVGRLLHDNFIEYNHSYDSLRPSFQIVKSKQ